MITTTAAMLTGLRNNFGGTLRMSRLPDGRSLRSLAIDTGAGTIEIAAAEIVADHPLASPVGWRATITTTLYAPPTSGSEPVQVGSWSHAESWHVEAQGDAAIRSLHRRVLAATLAYASASLRMVSSADIEARQKRAGDRNMSAATAERAIRLQRGRAAADAIMAPSREKPPAVVPAVEEAT